MLKLLGLILNTPPLVLAGTIEFKNMSSKSLINCKFKGFFTENNGESRQKFFADLDGEFRSRHKLIMQPKEAQLEI